MVAKKTKKPKAKRKASASKNNTEPLYPNFVRQWREKKGLSQAELADDVGIAVQQIYRLEGHTVALTYQMASRLAPALCERIGQLFSEDPTKPNEVTFHRGFAALTPKGKTMVLQYIDMLEEQGFSSKPKDA